MHWAARKGQKEIVELLISNGANVNAQDEDGGTPLFYASNPEITDLLRKNGAATEGVPISSKKIDYDALNKSILKDVSEKIVDKAVKKD